MEELVVHEKERRFGTGPDEIAEDIHEECGLD